MQASQVWWLDTSRGQQRATWEKMHRRGSFSSQLRAGSLARSTVWQWRRSPFGKPVHRVAGKHCVPKCIDVWGQEARQMAGNNTRIVRIIQTLTQHSSQEPLIQTVITGQSCWVRWSLTFIPTPRFWTPRSRTNMFWSTILLQILSTKNSKRI